MNSILVCKDNGELFGICNNRQEGNIRAYFTGICMNHIGNLSSRTRVISVPVYLTVGFE